MGTPNDILPKIPGARGVDQTQMWLIHGLIHSHATGLPLGAALKRLGVTAFRLGRINCYLTLLADRLDYELHDIK